MTDITHCPNCDWPLDQTTSIISIKAVDTSVTENGGVVEFLVTRTGPSDTGCQVTIAWTGSASLEDFEPGTTQSDVIMWEPADISERRLTLKLSDDRIVEGNEQVTTTLTDPINCSLGESSATISIVDDDVTPSKPSSGYNSDLPYGGLGMGTTPLLGQPGNQKVTSKSSMMIRCERSGSIAWLLWNNRFNGHGRTGYSDNNGGTISWTIQVVDDPTASTVKPGPVIGETRKIKDPVKAASWQAEWEAAGGKGSADTRFAEYPTLRFLRPIEVKQGDMLLFTQIQHGGGAVSINNAYTTCRSYDDWSPYTYHKSCRQFKGSSLSVRRPEHFPLVNYGYTDGVVKGTGACGDARGLTVDQESILIGGKTRARQCFTIPDWADGKIIRRVVSWWCRYEQSVSGELRCRLKLAGSDAFGANDEGTLLAASQINASSIPYRPKNEPKFGSPTKLIRHNFDNIPGPLKAGQVIYIEYTATGAKMLGFRMARWLGVSQVGSFADWGMKSMGGQRDIGDGWKTLNISSENKHDLPIWAEF